MKRIGILLLSFCLVVIFNPEHAFAKNSEREIIIGSFNIANLGDTNEYERSLITLVNIIRKMNADLLCIQEVSIKETGKEQVKRLVELLNMASAYYGSKPYDFAISEEYTGDETTAFIWRDPVTIQSEITLLDHEIDPDHDGKPTFQRVPSLALFSVDDFDFHIVNCHFYTKIIGASSEGREDEFKAVVKWLLEAEQQQEIGAVIVGDFNRFLNGKKPWKQFMITNYQLYYRFPILEAIQQEVPDFDPGKDEAPSDKFSTTTAKLLSIYDQIIVSKKLFDNVNAPPKFGTDIGIIDFDNDKRFEWFIYKWHNAIKMLSDHRPVWMKLLVK